MSRCGGFTQSLSRPVCRSVEWTCRLLNTYRNEENIHAPKQQPRTHTRWRKLLIYQIFIRCKCELKMMVLSPNTCFPAGSPSSCLPPVFLHTFPLPEHQQACELWSTACWLASLRATYFFTSKHTCLLFAFPSGFLFANRLLYLPPCSLLPVSLLTSCSLASTNIKDYDLIGCERGNEHLIFALARGAFYRNSETLRSTAPPTAASKMICTIVQRKAPASGSVWGHLVQTTRHWYWYLILITILSLPKFIIILFF